MTKQQEEQAKVKLAPIQDIYHRILWDKRLNKTAFLIGFTDRMSRTGVREKPFIEWNTGEIEIPWHRIQYIRCGDTKVWDRQQRIDLFASHRLPPESWAKALDDTQNDDASLFLPKQVYQFTANAWEPLVQEEENSAPASLRLVTYNVLSDVHEQVLINTPLRIQAIPSRQPSYVFLAGIKISGNYCVAWEALEIAQDSLQLFFPDYDRVLCSVTCQVQGRDMEPLLMEEPMPDQELFLW